MLDGGEEEKLLAGFRRPKIPESGVPILRTEPTLTLANESVGESCSGDEVDCCGLDDELPELLLLHERLAEEAAAAAALLLPSKARQDETTIKSSGNECRETGGEVPTLRRA